MREIILKMDSPKEAENFVLLLFQQGFKPQKAIISYSLRKKFTTRIKSLTDYPLLLEGTLYGTEMRVAVTPLAIGQRCEGSYSLKKILKTAGFYIEDQDLFTIKRFNPDTGYLYLTLSQK